MSSTKVQTPVFRVSYPNVFQARKNVLSGKEEYSVLALFPKGADMSGLKLAAQAAIEKKWGADKSKWPKNLKTPFRLHDEKKNEETGAYPEGMEEGGIFMNLKSKDRPGLVDEKVQDIIEATQFYAGCYARASVNAFAYDQAGNRGVNFGLNNIQKVKDGDPLGNRTRATDDFAPIENAGAASGASATDLFN